MNALAVQPRVPRLGFLGVGWIGRHRLEAIARSGVAELVAVVDASPAEAEKGAACACASTSGSICRTMGSLDEMLEEGVDGVVIATPNALHVDQSLRALERGAAVFCQKPLGRTEAETRRVVEAARSRDLLLGVDLSYRHLRGMAELRRAVQSGELGEIFAVDLMFHNAYGPDKPWFYDPRLSGGGCLIDLGIHLVDLALWMLEPASVREVSSRRFAAGRPVSGRSKVEDYAVARLDLARGTSVQLACSWRLHAGRDAVIEAAFYGTSGGAAVRNVEGSFFDFTVERFRGTAAERISAPPDPWGGRAAVAWAQRLAGGAGFDSEAEGLIPLAATLDRLYEDP